MTAYLLSLLSVFHLAKADPVFVLRSRDHGASIAQSSLSFRHMSQDPSVTKSHWDIRFDAAPHGNDYIGADTSLSANSFIYGSGKNHCFEITSSTEELRKTQPMKWLENSEANLGRQKYQSHREQLTDEEGCYLLFQSDDIGRLVVLFHVSELRSGESMKIDEIEVLEDWRK